MNDDRDIAEEASSDAPNEPSAIMPAPAAEPAVTKPEGVPAAAESAAAPDPATATVSHAADAALAEAVSGGLTWIPYAAYLGGWIALAGASAYLLGAATADQPARWMPEYPALVLAGVGLALVGPVLSLAVWLVARSRRRPESRRGLLASALTRGALVAFFGAVIWIVTLYLLEVFSGGGPW